MDPTDAAIEEWIGEELATDPVLATSLGAPGHDHRLGSFEASAFDERSASARRWASRLDGLVASTTDPDRQVDLTLLLAELAGRDAMHDWQLWRRDPDVYLQPIVQGVHQLFLHGLRPVDELVGAAVERLAQVPHACDSLRANLDPELAPRLLVERGRDAAHAGATYLRSLLATSAPDGPLRTRLAEAGEAAAAHLDELAGFLAAFAERAHGDWAIGETRYSALLRTRELLPFTAASLNGVGVAALAELEPRLAEVAAQISPGDDWRGLIKVLAADHPADPEAMRVAYEATCTLARSFLVSRGLVTLPEGEELQVVPSPVFERPLLAVASYSGPAPFSTSRVGRFFVPYPPEGTTDLELEQRLADNGHHAIPTTAVHEAYPGHHWQLTWSAATGRPLRKVLWSSYFVEGWALYAERMMHEQGFFTDPRQVLCHLDARQFRAARIVVDTALHCGEMTVDQAVAYMSTQATLTPAVARAEVDRYCSWPVQAPSYLTGSLEIERMRDRWFAEGRGDLRSFHDTLAANPGLPLALAERATFGP